MLKNTWTPEDVISEMKVSIREFGRYTFSDKGPVEVMDIHSIAEYLVTLPTEAVYGFIKKLRGKTKINSDRELVARSLLVAIDTGPWTEQEFLHICEASPGSY